MAVFWLVSPTTPNTFIPAAMLAISEYGAGAFSPVTNDYGRNDIGYCHPPVPPSATAAPHFRVRLRAGAGGWRRSRAVLLRGRPVSQGAARGRSPAQRGDGSRTAHAAWPLAGSRAVIARTRALLAGGHRRAGRATVPACMWAAASARPSRWANGRCRPAFRTAWRRGIDVGAEAGGGRSGARAPCRRWCLSLSGRFIACG